MIKIDASRLGKDIKALAGASKAMREKLVGEETMTGLGVMAARQIHQRTSSGRDADGETFKAYTKEYAKIKAKSGRSTKPDLTWSGRMLGAMASKFVSVGKAVVLFTRGEEANKAAGNSHKRDFFDVRLPGEITEIEKELERLVTDIKTKLGLA